MRGLSGIAARCREVWAGLAALPFARRPPDRDAGPDLAALSREIDGVARYVVGLKRDVGALRLHALREDEIPRLRADLAAIRVTAETAVEAILSAAEAVMSRTGSGDDPATEAKLMAIFEACSFGDIVGQRASRIEATLDAVEARIGRFHRATRLQDRVGVFDRDAILREARREVMIVDGPRRGGPAPDQGAIDRLLA